MKTTEQGRMALRELLYAKWQLLRGSGNSGNAFEANKEQLICKSDMGMWTLEIRSPSPNSCGVHGGSG